MNRWIKLGIGVLVLATSALSVHAQKIRPSDAPPPGSLCHCQAGGADCFFGSAQGCYISCQSNTCRCEGAWCLLGFPKPAKCYCE